MAMNTEIRDCLCDSLEQELDPWLLQHGFVRAKNTIVYTRRLPEAFQRIEIAFEVYPKDRPDAVAVVYPFLEVRMESVNALVKEMADGDESLIGATDITLREPIAFTAGNKGLGARWSIFQPESVSRVVGEVKSFLRQWTLPFLNTYSTPAGICEIFDRGDVETMGTLMEKLRIVAAMVLCGRTAEALSIMNRWFGKPGPRKRYQRVFDHLATNS